MADRVEPDGAVAGEAAVPPREPGPNDAAHQLARAPDPAVLTRLERLRPALAEATKEVQSLTFLLLFVGLYIGVVAGTTTHRMLLVGAQIQMPFLGVGVNLVGAYILAPILFLLLHFWLLRTLVALGTRVTAYQRDLALLPEPWAGEARRLVPAFPYLEWRLGSGRQALAGLICLALYALLPIALLLLIQLKFLPYQHDWITPWHMACIVGCVALVWTTWSVIDEPTRSRPRRILGAIGLLCVLAGSVVLWLDQRPPVLTRYAPETARRLDSTGWQGYVWSRLIVRDRILMAREPASDLLAEARAGKEGAAREAAETEVFLDRDLAEPLDLKGRNLRRADLPRSRLLGVVIEGTDLTGATLIETDLQRAKGNAATKLQGAFLWQAQLQGALLPNAQLQGVNLTFAHVQGADLREAKLQRAVFRQAQLQGVDLRAANLQDAVLSAAEMQDAILGSAELQGADLSSAQLQGAELQDAKLQGANLREARLQGAFLAAAEPQGADLRESQLQGAVVRKARLEGADLRWAKLDGADLREAQLQGANLEGASLWRAEIDATTNLSLAGLLRTVGQPPGIDYMKNLSEAIERIGDRLVTRARVLRRLELVFNSPEAPWDPGGPPRADDVLLDDNPDPAIASLVGSGINVEQHAPRLAVLLREVACSDPWTARGIVRRVTSGNDELLSAGALLEARCPAVNGLDPDLLGRLREVGAHATSAPSRLTPPEATPQSFAPEAR